MRFLIVLAFLTLPLAGLATADARAEDELLGRVFSEVERQIIRDYYHDRSPVGSVRHTDIEPIDDGGRGPKNKKAKKNAGNGAMPPGIANRDSLPPGLDMQLERGGRLPPGLEKRALPTDLASLLGHPLDGLHRQVVGTDVLLVETATGIILDILRGVATY